MKITEKTKDYLRLALSSLFLLALISLLMACGGGGAGAVADGSPGAGNTISGRMALSKTPSIIAARTLAEGSHEAYTTATVQLLDSGGNVAYVTTTDENGKFEFNNVAAGDYTVMVIDIKTGVTVAQISVSVLEGDDVSLEGVIDTTKTEWTINFMSNDEDSSDLLENDEQMKKAEILAKASGLSLDEVIDMRLSGMGWGVIAKKLGVDPGALGLDNDKAFEIDQTTDTTDDSVGSSADDNKDKGEHDYQNKPANNGGSGDQGEHDYQNKPANNGGSGDQGEHDNAGENDKEDD